MTQLRLIMVLFCLMGGARAAVFLEPTADTVVDSRYPDTNYGTEEFVNTYRDGTTEEVRKIYLRFDASGAGEVTNVLGIEAFNLYSGTAEREGIVDLVTNAAADVWSEDSITWNLVADQAGTGPDLAAGMGVRIGKIEAPPENTSGNTVSFTFIDDDKKNLLLNALMTGDRTVTLVICSTSKQARYASVENTTSGAFPVRLVLERVEHLPADTALTDAAFFTALNLNYPGLEGVKTAVNRGDYSAARRELCQYYRSRQPGFWWQEIYDVPADDSGMLTYESIVEQTGNFAPEYWMESGEFNWELTTDRFRRMYFFSSLGRSYRYTDDDEITHVWIDLFRAWIRQMSDDLNRLQMGIRLRSGWGDAFISFVHSPVFDDDSMFLFMKACYEQALYLRNNHSDTSNWLTFELAGLYSMSVLFPEWKNATDWRSYAVQVALDDLDKGWLPDGVSIEQTLGYGQFFKNYLIMKDLADETENSSPDTENIQQKTERLFLPYVQMMAPTGEYPGLNDSGAGPISVVLENSVERFPDRQDLLWGATGGAQGERPNYLSVAFPYAGYISIRSGWESDDNYLLFDAGPVGYRHAHQDKLEVILWAYGREILYDPGRENYDPDNPYQQYCLDTFSHSTGLVDNRPQRRRWYFDPSPLRNYPYGLAPDFKYDIQGSAVWASGAYTDSYGKAGSIGNHAYPYTDNSNFYEGWGTPAKHYRQVAYAAPDIFIVQDRFVPENTALHAYEIRWQLDSLAVTVNGADAETGDAGKPNLAIIPLRPSGIQVEAVSAQDTPEIMGWKVLEKSYPATTLRHLTSGTGPQGFLTLLYPLKPGETAGDMRISEQDGEMILDTDDGRRFLIHPAANSNDRLTLTDSGYTDSDGDELPDWWELRYFGGRTNARPETVCANGINTIHDAYVAGLDPNDPNDRFEVRAHRRDDETVISWPAVSGRVYTVCWTTNLLTGFHETNVSWPDREFTNRLSDHTGFYWLKVRREDSR